jgi:hypothetical protein
MARDPRKVSAQYVNRERGKQHERAHPEAPIEVHAPPIGTWIGLTVFAAVAFEIVFVSGHLFSTVTVRCCASRDSTNYCAWVASAVVRPGCAGGEVDVTPTGGSFAAGISVPAGKMRI